jgi:multimeric flavodoxin WrbA
MNEIIRWVAAHGIMIVVPVHWYQVPASLKLMMDRLVCADGGNPDPTTTQGKDPAMAKAIELKGWDYPRHLEGRLFSVVVHGDAEGVENVRRSDFRLALLHASLSRRADLRSSTAISDTGNLTPRATPISTPIPPFKTRCAMPPGRCSKRFGASSRGN